PASLPACCRDVLVDQRPSEREGRQGPIGSSLVRRHREALHHGTVAPCRARTCQRSGRSTEVTFCPRRFRHYVRAHRSDAPPPCGCGRRLKLTPMDVKASDRAVFSKYPGGAAVKI